MNEENDKWNYISKALCVIAIGIAVLGATYITKNPNCLWGLVVIYFL